MLANLPDLHYFQCKNQYSGAHAGMRYLLTPVCKTITDEAGEHKQWLLQVDIWPDPWALEYTDPALRRTAELPLTAEGIAEAGALLARTYEQGRAQWDNCPGILDCEPWQPPAPAAGQQGEG